MKNKIPQIDSEHFEGQRTGVGFGEIQKWLEIWPTVRPQVTSNAEACKVLSSMGRYRDPRTIQSYMERLLPLVNTKAISAIIDFISDCESRMSIKEFMRIIRERLPAEELGPKLSILADALINELPPPDQVLQALGSILAGGFPFDSTRLKK